MTLTGEPCGKVLSPIGNQLLQRLDPSAAGQKLDHTLPVYADDVEADGSFLGSGMYNANTADSRGQDARHLLMRPVVLNPDAVAPALTLIANIPDLRPTIVEPHDSGARTSSTTS